MRILAIDQGTTSSKAFWWEDGKFSEAGRRVQRQIRPRPGWVEHDAEELARHVTELAALAGPGDEIALANQGETVVAWDAQTLRPLHNALVWQDERTSEAIPALREAGLEALTLAIARLPLDPYFAVTRLRWLLDNADGARELLKAGRLRLGTSDAFLRARLTGVAMTDIATASRTSLMDVMTGQWDARLGEGFGVPIECLPPIGACTGDFGVTPRGARLTAAIVDQQAALFGQGCRAPGEMKITFGTGAFALGVLGAAPSEGGRADGLLPTLGWRIAGQAPVHALDGGILTAGAAIEWLGEIGLLPDHAALDGFEGPSALERGIVFVPAQAGLGAPHWDRSARGMWIGMDLATSAADLRRAVLEGIAIRAAELVGAFGSAMGGVSRIAIDGGLTRSGYFRQFLANAVGAPIMVSREADMTGLGLAHLCLVARSEVPPAGGFDEVLPEAPLPPALHARFAEALRRSRGWA